MLSGVNLLLILDVTYGKKFGPGKFLDGFQLDSQNLPSHALYKVLQSL